MSTPKKADLPKDVNNPGTVEVEDEAFGKGLPKQVTPGEDVANQAPGQKK